MDPIRPNPGPSINRPDVNAPQTTPVGGQFGKELGATGPGDIGAGGAKSVSHFERVGEFVRKAAARNPDRAAVFREVIDQEIKATFGPAASPETIQKATQVLSESREMVKLFDQLYDKATVGGKA